MYANDLYRRRIKLRYILIVLGITILIASSFGVYSYGVVQSERVKDKIEEPSIPTIAKVEVIKKAECDDKTELYFTQGIKKIYLYCLENVIITIEEDDREMELKEYISRIDDKALDIITVNFMQKLEWNYPDRWTVLFTSDEFNVLKCHTEEGNKDMYIGDKKMEYFDGFCK